MTTFWWLNHPFGGLSWVIVLIHSMIGSFSWGSRSGLLDWILHLVLTHRATTILLVLFILHWRSVKMHSILLGVSVRAPRDFEIQYRSLNWIFIFLRYLFRQRGSLLLINSLQRAFSCTWKVSSSIHPSYFLRHLGTVPYLLWSFFCMSPIGLPFGATLAWCVQNLVWSIVMVVFADLVIG